jgi:preprotein translocase subunit SecD
MKILKIRVWILIIALAFAILAINPSPGASGIQITNVQPGSPSAEAGIKTGEIIQSINRQPIESLADYTKAINNIRIEEKTVTVETDKGTFTYTTMGELGFTEENLTITSVSNKLSDVPIEQGMKIKTINNKPMATSGDISTLSKQLFPKAKFILETDKGEYPLLITTRPQISAGLAKKSNINKGLELQGGTRVLLQPQTDEVVSDQEVQDIIDVLGNRLDVYGLSDLKLRPANDLAGKKFVLVEIAGASREEVRDLIGQQGKFEAKIGEETVFIGGDRDIAFVCRNDGSCSGIRPPCRQTTAESWSCTFQFAITLSEEAAEQHATVTGELEVNATQGGSFYLEKQLDLYVDDKLVDSLNIGADLKGKAITQIAISGPGLGTTEEAAYDDALDSMNRLQTILITGSLPYKLDIVKLDTISPILGQEFVKNSLLVGIVAILAVSAVVFIRYRKIKIIIPMIIISLSEVVIILGVAALIGWNLDLASIAGIIAAVGTGVDDQIVITDEVMRRGSKYSNWKEKIKRAFFIILTAYATTVAAMIPLWNAGAGLVRGFAVTTIIGVTIGVFITRPAFASLVESLLEK